MANIANVFIDMIKNKNEWLKAETGNNFEDIFQHKLRSNGYYQLINKPKHGNFVYLKECVLNKIGTELLFLSDFEMEDIDINNSYLMQPYGSQNYPDFLVFTNNHILPIELKYSKGKSISPMWNGNLPKYNGIYIFASNGKKDITFFIGNDVLPHEERKELVHFWEKTRQEKDKYTDYLRNKTEIGDYEFNRGFNIYIRETYMQSTSINKKAQLNYFEADDREKIEDLVISFMKEIN